MGALATAGITLIGAGIPVAKSRGLVGRLTGFLSSNREIIIGAMLFVIQYQLTEEESSVRGVVAGLGGALMVFGILTRRFATLRGRLWTTQ